MLVATMLEIPETVFLPPGTSSEDRAFILSQLTPEVIEVLNRLYEQQAPVGSELDLPVNTSEAAVLLSIKSGRPVSHRYVKELYRTKGRDGRPISPRLKPIKPVGHSHLFRLGDVYEQDPITHQRGTRSGRPSKEQLLISISNLKTLEALSSRYEVSQRTIMRWLAAYGLHLRD